MKALSRKIRKIPQNLPHPNPENPELSRKTQPEIPNPNPEIPEFQDQLTTIYTTPYTGDNGDNPDIQVEDVAANDGGIRYAAPIPEPPAATVLTEEQFYDLFKGLFSGLEWIVNKRLEAEKITLTSIHIQDHEQATAQGLCAEIYKIANEPGSPISWMIAPPTKYGPVAVLGFNFLMLKKESIALEIRALRAKNIAPENPETEPEIPKDNPENPEEQEQTT